MDNQYLALMKLLALGDLLEPVSKVQAEVRYISESNINIKTLEVSDHDAIEGLMKELGINDRKTLLNWGYTHLLTTDPQAISEYAKYRFKRRCLIEELIASNGQALFLRYKDRLDRVLYSLIRVNKEDHAYHLYYQIESEEIDFGDAAREHSMGPEAKTQGIIGPCDLTVPHPDIASRLRTANPKQLFSPFAVEEWFAILRLEYRFESEYNDTTKNFLGQLLLNSKTQQISGDIYKDYLSNFNPS